MRGSFVYMLFSKVNSLFVTSTVKSCANSRLSPYSGALISRLPVHVSRRDQHDVIREPE